MFKKLEYRTCHRGRHVLTNVKAANIHTVHERKVYAHKKPFVMRSNNVYKSTIKPFSDTKTNIAPQVQTYNSENKNKFNNEKWNQWKQTVNEFYNRSPINILPLMTFCPDDNRPYIKTKICNSTVLALLDSGANASIIGGSGLHLLSELGLPVKPLATENSITTADGNLQPIIGYIQVPLEVSSTIKYLDFLIVPNVKQAMILGSDFCHLFNVNLNFKANTWSSNCLLTHVSSLSRMQELSDAQKLQLDIIIAKYTEMSNLPLGRTHVMKFNIDTGDTIPIKQRPYPMSPAMLKILYQELDQMLADDVIEPSNSPWSSPVLLVKKASGEFRLCFDGRRLNSVTKADAYPIPLVEQLLNKLHDAKFISSLDLRSAFWQIPLDDSSREKTAFPVPGRGLFQFKVLPFGLRNAAISQQRLMDTLFGPEYEGKIFCYLDDIIIISPTFEEHMSLLITAYNKLSDAGLTIRVDKCKFCRENLKFLGYIVDAQGLRTDPEKVEAIKNFKRPETATQIKRFIGTASWYRRFIKGFSTIVAPINDLLKGKKKTNRIMWNEQAEQAFVTLKNCLTSDPIVSTPDFTKPFIIQCDASEKGVGAVLAQEVEGGEKVIAYASRSLNKNERNYSVTEKECLAVIFGLDKFRAYVEGVHCTVITDHYSLLWLFKIKDPTGRLARWSVRLSQFDFELKHRKGALNVVPDALSRDTIINIDIINFERSDHDPWYTDMLSKIRSIPENYPNWRIENDQLFKLVKFDHQFINQANWKLVVPTNKRIEVLKEAHDSPLSAHLGIFKTLKRVSEFYYWPQLRRDVIKYVRNCKVCLAQKSPNLVPSGQFGQFKNVTLPFQLISIDLMGPLPRSLKGNTSILVVSDWFTKFSLLLPMRDAKVSKIIEFIENTVFLIFGVPQIIICDNGAQFKSREFKKLVATYKVQKVWYNALYHPQVNPVERVNRVIKTAIRSYISENQRKWDVEIFKVSQALRTAVHEVTGYSPSFLTFARNVPVSGDYYGPVLNSQVKMLRGEEYYEHVNNFSNLYDQVGVKLKKAYDRNAHTYNLRRRPLEFFVGDHVWKKNYTLSNAANYYSAKLAPRYIPCIVSKKISKLVYELTDENNVQLGRWHIKDLKPSPDLDSDLE